MLESFNIIKFFAFRSFIPLAEQEKQNLNDMMKKGEYFRFFFSPKTSLLVSLKEEFKLLISKGLVCKKRLNRLIQQHTRLKTSDE